MYERLHLDETALRAWAHYEKRNQLTNETYDRNRDTIDSRYGDLTPAEARLMLAAHPEWSNLGQEPCSA